MERELIISRGGRYDACASRIAEKPVSACGFAFMMEPIVTLLGYRPQPARAHPPTDIVIIAGQPRVAAKAMLLGRSLRQQFPYLSIINDCSPQRISTRYKIPDAWGRDLFLKSKATEKRLSSLIHGTIVLRFARLITSPIGSRRSFCLSDERRPIRGYVYLTPLFD